MNRRSSMLALLLLVGVIAVAVPVLGAMQWGRFTPHLVVQE